jgi:geranylgeranyl diphosphate synthase type I
LYNEVREKVSEKDVLQVHEFKTSRYTIEGPLHLGAILAGASEKDLDVLSAYGLPLGQAFQLQDDVLGTFGREEKLGKPVDSDLKQGKKTVLVLRALEKASPEQKKKLLACLGNKDLTKEMAEEARNIIKATGSYDYSKTLAEKLCLQAKQAIQKSRFRSEGKDFLLGIADYMLHRDY